MARISALGWSSDLRNLSEMNFIQPYDNPVVSTRKYRHIELRGTHNENLKSSQFFFEGNVKKLEGKFFENKTYVRANVLHSMKKTPYRAVLEFSPTCDVLSAACTYAFDLINNLASGRNLPNIAKVFSRNRIAEFDVIENSFRGRVAHFLFFLFCFVLFCFFAFRLLVGSLASVRSAME